MNNNVSLTVVIINAQEYDYYYYQYGCCYRINARLVLYLLFCNALSSLSFFLTVSRVVFVE